MPKRPSKALQLVVDNMKGEGKSKSQDTTFGAGDDYTVLQKKVKKIQSILQEIEENEGTDTKEI